jgi:hypothetical protein
VAEEKIQLKVFNSWWWDLRRNMNNHDDGIYNACETLGSLQDRPKRASQISENINPEDSKGNACRNLKDFYYS